MSTGPADQVVFCAHTRMAEIDSLVPYPGNENVHSEAQIKLLAKIMRHNGVRNPITVSKRSGFITKGHGRLEAAKLNGWTHFPVDDQEYPNEAAEHADRVADNRIQELSEVDEGKFKATALTLPEGFDLELLGVPDLTLQTLQVETDGETDPDDAPAPPAQPRTKRGELWTLGDHRLLIDDCTVPENVARLMGGEKADLVFTDPPYNVASENDLVAHSVSDAMNRLKESKWDQDFKIGPAMGAIDSLVAPDCSIYVCTSHHLAGEIWGHLNRHSNHTNYCVWGKPNPMPSLMKRHWTWATELICYATRGKHVFNFPSEGHALSFWTIQKNQKNDLHPTQKPVAVPEHAIIHSSNPGQLVVDLFLGAGSTLIACEKNGRRCYGMEIDPLYADVILTRWADFTGKTPVREDGTQWAELTRVQ